MFCHSEDTQFHGYVSRTFSIRKERNYLTSPSDDVSLCLLDLDEKPQVIAQTLRLNWPKTNSFGWVRKWYGILWSILIDKFRFIVRFRSKRSQVFEQTFEKKFNILSQYLICYMKNIYFIFSAIVFHLHHLAQMFRIAECIYQSRTSPLVPL